MTQRITKCPKVLIENQQKTNLFATIATTNARTTTTTTSSCIQLHPSKYRATTSITTISTTVKTKATTTTSIIRPTQQVFWFLLFRFL